MAGFALVEVMVGMVLSAIFVAGLTGLWTLASAQTRELTLQQKTVFVLGGEMERLSALYNRTNFEKATEPGLLTSGICGGLLDPLFGKPSCTYPSSVSAYMGGSADNFVTNNATTFRGSDFLVYYVGSFESDIRNFVWIERSRGLMAMLYWASADISPGAKCALSGTCRCADYGNGPGNDPCKIITLVLQYPFRLETSGTITRLPNTKSLSLITIVGRTS